MGSMSSPTKDSGKILLRPARLEEMPKLANTALSGYAGSEIDLFLKPFRLQYPNDAIRFWTQKLILRWLDPRVTSVVACPESDPEKVVGYALFLRLGDDDGAKRQIASRKTIYLSVMYWYYFIKFKIMNYFLPDRSVNPDTVKLFARYNQIDMEKNWKSFPERQNRWHVRSLVVNPEWQGKGIGTVLLKRLLDKAREEGTIIGLEASPVGEYLYRKVGFELLSRFYHEAGSPLKSDAGGIMMWKPEKMKHS